jgi:hypothetical protein
MQVLDNVVIAYKKINPFPKGERIYGNIQKQSQKIKCPYLSVL